MDTKTDELRYAHFSHNHLLDYTKLQPHGHAKCSGCRQIILPENYYYKCNICHFYLHQTCFNMPQNVTHPSHPNHNLTLKTSENSSKVSIFCKACEYPIKGFYYTCYKSINHYHSFCLSAPLSLKTPLHRHTINVEFEPVYDFQCDLCNKPSYSGWVYHCNLCEFDAHLSCVVTNDKGSKSNLFQDQDPSLPSFQLSETCFSIDFQKSLLENDQEAVPREGAIAEEMKMDDGDLQEHGFEDSKRSEKSKGSGSGRKSGSLGGIGAQIWTDLEHDTEKRNSKARDQRIESHTESSSCSNLPKLFMCFFNDRQNRSSRGKFSSPRK